MNFENADNHLPPPLPPLGTHHWIRTLETMEKLLAAFYWGVRLQREYVAQAEAKKMEGEQ